MYTQLRIYTVNRDTMDEWVAWWHKYPKRIGEAVGQKVTGGWVNEERSDFIWMRSYANAEGAKQKDAAFAANPDWNAIRPESRKFIAKAEITPMQAESIERPAKFTPYAQLRIYTISRGEMARHLTLFRGEVVPVHKEHGHSIYGPWTNEQKTKMIWLRNYQSPEDAKAKDQGLYDSPAWKALLPRLVYVANVDVKPIFAVPQIADP